MWQIGICVQFNAKINSFVTEFDTILSLISATESNWIHRYIYFDTTLSTALFKKQGLMMCSCLLESSFPEFLGVHDTDGTGLAEDCKHPRPRGIVESYM